MQKQSFFTRERRRKTTKKAAIWTSVFPCIDCAKLIVAAGIEQVYYISEYDREDDGWKFLTRNNIYKEKI